MEYQEFVYRNRWPIVILLMGITLFCVGFYFYSQSQESEELVVNDTSLENIKEGNTIIVEISGAVEKPGVYKLPLDSRIEDLLKEAGGFREENKEWVERFINRAAKLVDGQKVYIPTQDQPANAAGRQTYSESANNLQGSVESGTDVLGVGSNLININTASQTQLESLWGIGPVYAKNIIDQRPYSDISELTSKKIIKQNVFEKISDQISVY